MRIFDEKKEKELNPEQLDLNLGYLKKEYLITEIDEILPQDEKGHYEVIAEYPESGGEDIQWVIDTPAVEGRKKETIKEQINIYIPYTSEELQQIEDKKQNVLKKEIKDNRIKTNKAFLTKWSEDIIQFLAGEKVEDIQSKIDGFLLYHDELRNLQDQIPRQRTGFNIIALIQQVQKNAELLQQQKKEIELLNTKIQMIETNTQKEMMENTNHN